MFHVNNRNKNCLCRSAANLPCFQKDMYYADIKIFDILPLVPKYYIHKEKFVVALGRYLHTQLNQHTNF